jgi:hypothetical protein
MTTPDDTYEWLPVRDAADRLHTSASTVLRMIREGSLVAELGPRSERDRRPQYLVRFDRPQDTPMSTPEATIPRQKPSDVTAAHVDAIMQLAEQVAELREERGRLEAERDAARTASDDARARLAASEARESALTAEAAELRRQLARRRWYDPRTWGR